MKRWRRRRAKKIHVILEWFARAECSTHFTALYWALLGSTSLEQGRSWLNPKATSTLLLAAPKRAYCGANSQKRRSTRLHRSLHLMPFFRASFIFFLASFLSPVFILFLVSLRFRLHPRSHFFLPPSPLLLPSCFLFSCSLFLCESN